MKALQQQISRFNSWLLILLAFSLPLSTSVVTITVLLIMVCWLVEGGYGEKWREIIVSPICIAVFVFLGVMLVGLCWTDDFMSGVKAIGKLWKVWLLPVFLTTVRWGRRWWYVAAFIAGVTVVMLLIDFSRFNLLPVAAVSYLSGLSIIYRHIVFTPMLAFVSYLLLHQLLWGEAKGGQRWLMLVLAVMIIFNIFITQGRIGQIAFFVLMALLLFQFFRSNLLKAVLVMLVLLPLVFTAAYRFSPVFQGRMDEIRQNVLTYEKNPDTSVGLRLTYWKNSWEIIKTSPWFGVGTGNFNSTYSRINLQASPGVPTTDNPHNEYIVIAVQLGLFGLLSMLSLFFVQIYQAGQITDGWERIRLAFPLFFLTIMLTDSYLNTSGSGFMFSLCSAIFFKSKLSWQAKSVPSPLVATLNHGTEVQYHSTNA